MKNLTKLPLLALALLAVTLFSCESDDPSPENDGEVITDVILNFQELDEDGAPVGDSFSFTASDPEGIENGAPTIETITLEKGKTYRLSIELENSIEGESITEEIEEEADEHQFYFLGSLFSGSPAPAAYAYDDEGGIKLGLRGIVTMSVSPGMNTANFRLVLRHDLNKDYPGADNPHFADFAQAGGETDLDITFPVVIE